MRVWVGHVSRMKERVNSFKMLTGKPRNEISRMT